MTTGSRPRPLGRGSDGSVPTGRGGTGSTGRLGSLGDVQPAGGSDAGGGAGPSSLQPPARRLTPAERFKPKPQPRSTRRASTEPKPDPDPPATRTTRSGRNGGDDAPSPSGRRGNGAGAAPAVKPDPDAMDVGGAAAPPGRAAAPPPPLPASAPRRAARSESSSSDDDEDGGRMNLSASASLRADVSSEFPYAARLARRVPPPLDLAPPPGAAGAAPSASPRHFPVSAFGSGLDGGLTLLQLPDRLPASAADRTPPPASPRDPAGAAAVQGCASLADLPPGVIGRVLVLASGAVKVHIGDVEYALVPGMPVDSLAAGVRLDLSGGGRSGGGGGGAGTSGRRPSALPTATSASVGQVVNRATLVPDVGRLLAGGTAPEYRRAAGFKGPRALDAEWAARANGGGGGGGMASPAQRRAVVASDDDEDGGGGGGGVPARPTGRAARVVMDDESD